MTLMSQMADHALGKHPVRAGMLLERLGVEEATRAVSGARPESAGPVLDALSSHFSAAVLSRMEPARGAAALAVLPLDTIARRLRHASDPTREAIVACLPAATARGVQAMLRFPENSAGAMMDPTVLALPMQLTAREALQRIRKDPAAARYNVYVVDGDQRLVGVLNLRELLLAKGRLTLSDLMVRDLHRITATADRASVLSHPGWKGVHTLPVVDDDGRYLGALRYRTLRALEEELLSPHVGDADASEALGGLLAAAGAALLDAMGSTREGGRDGGR